MSDSAVWPLVSVIVPIRNEADFIARRRPRDRS
jgi:hypothetical protein